MTKFKITITKIEENVPYTSKVWKKVVDEPDEKHDEIYRYVTTEDVRDISTTVLEQTVEGLDMQAVIKAVNKL